MISYSTLFKAKELFDETLKIIETEFKYQSPNKFNNDFFPLIREENWEHCHIMLQDEKPIGHIGVRIISLGKEETYFKVALLGGIAIKEEYQGRGLFRDFFHKVLDQYKEATFYMLWSDKKNLYEKFNFYPAIKMNVYKKDFNKIKFNFIKTKLRNLTSNEKKELLNLYNKEETLKPKRDLETYSFLEKIESANLYLKKENEIISEYFIEGKGQDLNGIVHESYIKNESSLNEVLSKFDLWTTKEWKEKEETVVASALVKIASISKFSNFIHFITGQNIFIMQLEENSVHFRYKGNKLTMDIENFLLGVLGPGRFNELEKKAKEIFIPGVDSI